VAAKEKDFFSTFKIILKLKYDKQSNEIFDIL